MGAVAYSELLAAARVLADQRIGGSDAFISDTEGYRLVNRAVEAMRSELIKARGHEWLATERTFSTVSGTASYTIAGLSTLHYQTISVELEWSSTDVEDVPGLEWPERADLKSWSWGQWLPKAYRIVGTNIVFTPTPTSVVTVRHTYIPAYVDGTSSTTFDGYVDGWRDVVEFDVAARIVMVERQDASDLLRMKAEALERVQAAAGDLAARQPIRIVDVQGRGSPKPRGWWHPRSTA